MVNAEALKYSTGRHVSSVMYGLLLSRLSAECRNGVSALGNSRDAGQEAGKA